jgi:hypothetical protein
MVTSVHETAELVTLVFSGVTMLTAVLGTVVGLRQFSRQVRNRHLETAIQLRDKVKDFNLKHDLFSKLSDDDASLAQIDISERMNMLGTLEIVGLALKSGALDENMAANFFGFYAVNIRKSEYFLKGILVDSVYWREFSDFARRMEKHEQRQVSKSVKHG